MDNLSFERSPIIKYREQKMENQSFKEVRLSDIGNEKWKIRVLSEDR